MLEYCYLVLYEADNNEKGEEDGGKNNTLLFCLMKTDDEVIGDVRQHNERQCNLRGVKR